MLAGIGQAIDTAEGRTILLDGAGRAFCAGGDIKAQALAIRAGRPEIPADYFRREYGLNAKIHAYKRAPFVSYLNGIVMGGGYGVSGHGSHLVACEATRFAMPEVKIGFFPDVGAVFNLARVPGELGTYMALTGNSVGAADMIHIGLAHAYVPMDDFPRFRAVLVCEGAAREGVAAALDQTAQPVPDDGILRRHEEMIARCFAHDRVEAIVDALRSEGGDFAIETAMDIEARAPFAVKIALGHIRKARGETFETVIARDLALALRFLTVPDFAEGVRAAVIDKDRAPRWSPARLDQVDDKLVALYLGNPES